MEDENYEPNVMQAPKAKGKKKVIVHNSPDFI